MTGKRLGTRPVTALAKQLGAEVTCRHPDRFDHIFHLRDDDSDPPRDKLELTPVR